MSPWSQDVSSVVVICVPCPYRNIYINIHVALRVAEPQEYCAVPLKFSMRVRDSQLVQKFDISPQMDVHIVS
jgi:hypothetical protein